MTLNSICFTLVETYEKFAGQYPAEVNLVVIKTEICDTEKIAQRRQDIIVIQNILSIEPCRSKSREIKRLKHP